jgi:hypothetical protein
MAQAKAPLLMTRTWIALLLSVMAQAKPNVLFIVVDDLGTAISPYGGAAKAPNMARLAASGAQFQFSYVSIAVCSPSRTAFLTGLRPDTTQVWTIGPYFRRVARGEGMSIVTLPQLFKRNGYNTTGAGKVFHPGSPSGGLISSEGGGDMCPGQGNLSNCRAAPTGAGTDIGSWTEPYYFCDQYTNDTVQSPAMQQWPCSLHGAPRASENATYTWPSCGGGCVQTDACIACFTQCGTWGKGGSWDSCDCPAACYPEGLVADRAIRTLREFAGASTDGTAPFFLAVGLKRPHLSYRAPSAYFEMYATDDVALPLHPRPSPSAPALSYNHNCLVDEHTAKSAHAAGARPVSALVASAGQTIPPGGVRVDGPGCVKEQLQVSVLLCTVTFYAIHAHNLTRSP